MQKKSKSTAVLEGTLLDLHQHLTRLEWLIQEYIFFSKKVIQMVKCLLKFKVIADRLFSPTPINV